MEENRMTWGQKLVLGISTLILAVLGVGVIIVVMWATVGISYTRADGARVTLRGDVTTIEWPDGKGPVCNDCKPWSDGQAWFSQEFDRRTLWVESR